MHGCARAELGAGGTTGNDSETVDQDDLQGGIRMRRHRGARTIESVAHLLNLERPADKCDVAAALGEQMRDGERTARDIVHRDRAEGGIRAGAVDEHRG